MKTVTLKNKQAEELKGKYVVRYFYTDIDTIGVVCGMQGKSTLLYHPVRAVKQVSHLNFVVGGFLAHCTNQSEQRWLFEIDEKVTCKIRISKAFDKQYRLKNEPVKYSDYNF